MSDDLEHVTPASTTYGDWRGNVSAEQGATFDYTTVYKALDIDSERWFVVGIDVHHDLTEPGIEVYAVDKHATGIGRNDDIRSYAQRHGTVPVTSLYAHKPTPAALFAALFNRFSLQLRLRGTEDHDLVITGRGDLDLDED